MFHFRKDRVSLQTSFVWSRFRTCLRPKKPNASAQNTDLRRSRIFGHTVLAIFAMPATLNAIILPNYSQSIFKAFIPTYNILGVLS
jgi:hypothetical protein